MIAIVIASQQYPELHGLDEHLPLSLFPLVDRPLLHHIIEYLVEQGVRRFEFILSHLADKIESYLGDGARWGCSFGFHLIPSFANPYRMAQTIALQFTEGILLGRADCLPEMNVVSHNGPTLFLLPSGDWSGWALLPRGSIIPDGAIDELFNAKAGEQLPEVFTRLMSPRVMSFRSGPELLSSEEQLMAGKFSGLMIGGRQSETGIWISRNVTLHPTAIIEAPVFIGPNCRVARGARIGPAAVISENCILDDYSSVRNSVVAPGTYIGQGLELDQVLVDRNRLVNVRIGTSFLVSDTFLLSSLIEHTKHRSVQQFFSRLGALLLLLTFAPVAALVLLSLRVTQRGELYLEKAIRIPADDNPAGWREYSILRFRTYNKARHNRWYVFLLYVWPALLSVLRGDLFLVGVKPRTRAEAEGLPFDWKSIYLKSKAGLITEAEVIFGDEASAEETYTAEAYYSATESFRHDMKLARRYLGTLIIDLSRSRAGLARDSGRE